MDHYLTGKLFGKMGEKELAINHLEISANAGHLDSMCELGRIYYDYERFDNIYKGLYEKWLLKASKLGHARSQFFLGWSYRAGIGAIEDIKKSNKWYKLSIKNGYGRSAFDMGYYYADGFGFTINYNKAVEYFKIAISLGYKMNNKETDKYHKILELNERKMDDHAMGSHFKKIGHFKDAIKYFKRAANNGNKMSKFELGCLYGDMWIKLGRDIKDYDHAIKWFKLSKHGDAQSRINYLLEEMRQYKITSKIKEI